MTGKAKEGWMANAQGLQGLLKTLTEMGPRLIPWEIAGMEPKVLSYVQACKTCRFVAQGPAGRRACQERFLKALASARQRGRPVQFICPIQRYAVCLPLVRGSRSHGYLAVCHSERAFPDSTLRMAEAALQAALLERERAEELKNLSETIQPRCVALSTVHTLHRLISSTLNLEELLPRVARLCCQVLRADACHIWLTDRDKRLLIPRAAVAAQENSGRNSRRAASAGWKRTLPFGQGVPGEVAESWKAKIQPFLMAVPLVEEEACIGVLLVRRKGGQRGPFSVLDQETLTTLSEQAVVAIRNAQMYEAQERLTWGTIRSLSAILDGMDTYSTGGRSRTRLLAAVAAAIGRELKLPAAQIRSLECAALLHDAGRVGIPEEILKKPTPLEPAEYAKIKEHPVKGASLLQPLEMLEPAVPIILHHHERYDGTGYPNGLKKEAIPLGARILAVANAFEAMVSDRPYRRSRSIQEAGREISSHAGTQFDPKVVEAFLALLRRGQLESLVASGANGS